MNEANNSKPAEAAKISISDMLLARQAVFCPKCKAQPGYPCTSTGGGNSAEVATHQLRIRRVQGWPKEFAARAGQAVKSVRHKRSIDSAPELFAEFEAAAAPIAEKTSKPPTPKGVQLSEKQAEEIERYVHCGGTRYVSTAHFHGDHQNRQTANALEARGILEFVEMTTDHYERRMRLTAFGWQVYRQHRLIIRRLDEAEVDALEAKASATAGPVDPAGPATPSTGATERPVLGAGSAAAIEKFGYPTRWSDPDRTAWLHNRTGAAEPAVPGVDTGQAVDDAVEARMAATRTTMYEAIGDALAARSGQIPTTITDHIRGCLEDAGMIDDGRPTAYTIAIYSAAHGGLSAAVRHREPVEQLPGCGLVLRPSGRG